MPVLGERIGNLTFNSGEIKLKSLPAVGGNGFNHPNAPIRLKMLITYRLPKAGVDQQRRLLVGMFYDKTSRTLPWILI